MSAAAFAIIGALSFSFGGIVTRRAVLNVVDATVGVLISVPISIPFFLLILIAMGQVSSLASFSWQSYLWFSAAGIVHFILGRSLGYNSVQLVGANITNIVRRISPLIATTLGIFVLGEPLTGQLIAGVLLIIGGLVVAGANPQMLRGGHNHLSGVLRKGVLFGLGSGLAWGISPILVKMGLNGSGSPVAGAFISYSAATIILSISLWNNNRRNALINMNSRAVGLFSLVGIISAIAQLMRYVALSMAPVSVVSPIFSIAPVFTLVLSFLINRTLEVFNVNIIIGTIAVVAGTILLI